MSGYRTIVADPPWDYSEGFVSMPRGDTWGHREDKPLPYGSMSVDQIAALPIADLADPKGAYAFMWTTSRYLPASFAVLDAWGFTYRQTLVWHKVKSVTPFGGTLAPNHAEFVLVGKRGDVKLIGRAESSVLVAPGMSGRRTKAQGRDAEGCSVVFDDLLYEGQSIADFTDKDGNAFGPMHRVVRRDDGLWVE